MPFAAHPAVGPCGLLSGDSCVRIWLVFFLHLLRFSQTPLPSEISITVSLPIVSSLAIVDGVFYLVQPMKGRITAKLASSLNAFKSALGTTWPEILFKIPSKGPHSNNRHYLFSAVYHRKIKIELLTLFYLI